MNVRDLYHLLQNRYPQDKRDLNTLAWPLHQPTLDVQFLDKDGHRIPPIKSSATDIQYVEPLGGPFYDLSVIGLTPVFKAKAKRFGPWKQVRIVAQIATGPTLSSIVGLRISPKELKGLASELGIQWYHVNFDWPWTFTPVPTLDDCVKYERQTNESSV